MPVAVRNHYDVLGVAPDAGTDTIRAAYRRLAREYHPDRVASSSAVGGSRSMPDINEAYRVLNDPGRRAVYDRELRGGSAPRDSAATQSTTDDRTPHAAHGYAAHPYADRPARVPWRMLLVSGTIAIIGILVLAQFTGVSEQVGPDGILRNGDCVEILPNNDAKEVSCSGSVDLVVRAFIPFDATCPGFTEPHRDRQGMGVACIESVADPVVGD